jgi:hypothetical protein
MGARAWAISVTTAASLAVGSVGAASAAPLDPPVANPESVTFETLLIGSQDEATVHFSAPSALPFVTESVAVVGGDAFTIVGDTCSGLEARSACDVTVRFHPLTAGSDRAVLRLDALTGTTDVALTGRALCCVVTVHDASAVEADGTWTPVPIVVHREGPSDEPLTFEWRLLEGSAGVFDVNPIGDHTTTMPAGVADLVLPISARPDDEHEETETFTVQLLSSSDAFIGSPSLATGTIEDDDPVPPPPPPPHPTITAEGDGVVEQDDVDTLLTVPITLSQPVAVDTTFRVTIGSLGSATASRDHEPLPPFSVTTVPAGSSTARVVVRILGDGRPEDTETIHLQLGEVFGSKVAGQTLVTIDDDDAVSTVVATPAALGPFSLRGGSGAVGFVAWRGGAPSGIGTLAFTSGPRPEAPRLLMDHVAGSRLTDLTALSMRSCRTGHDAPEIEIAMASGQVLRAATNGAIDSWQTFDGVDRLVWTVGFGGFTSFAQYQADHPADRIATIAVVVPSTGAGGATAHLDRVLVGTTAIGVERFDLEPRKGTPKTVPSGTCQASPFPTAGGGLPGGDLPGTG